MDDTIILQKIKENDQRVITDLYKRYFKEVISYLQKNYPSFTKQDAEDIFNNSFYILCDNIKAGKNKKDGALKQYIYGICWHLAYDETKRRDRARGKSATFDPPIPDEEDWIELDRKTTLLTDTVSKLTEPCKSLLELFWFHLKRDAEIVQLMKYSSADTVKMQRSRCMRTLKKVYLSELLAENLITISEKKRLIGE